MAITPTQRRVFIAIDEWLGIVLLLYLHETSSSLFFPVLITWAIMVYAISYPLHWWKEYKGK